MLPLGKRNKTKPFTDAVLSLLAPGLDPSWASPAPIGVLPLPSVRDQQD